MQGERRTTTWICDQCGYVIAAGRDDSVVAENHVMLTVRGHNYHFHGTNETDGDRRQLGPWDARSCLQRWLTAQDHRIRGKERAAEGRRDLDTYAPFMTSETDAITG